MSTYETKIAIPDNTTQSADVLAMIHRRARRDIAIALVDRLPLGQPCVAPVKFDYVDRDKPCELDCIVATLELVPVTTQHFMTYTYPE